MKLTDLEPQFIRYETRREMVRRVKPGVDPMRHTPDDIMQVEDDVHYKIPVDSLDQAQGVWLLCPKCFQQNGGPVRTHRVEVTFAGRGVADADGTHNNQGQPVRWQVSGTGYHDLTTRPSVLLQGCCGWHGFITNGDVTSC